MIQRQVFDIIPQKGITLSESNEILRVHWERAYEADRTNNFDPSRLALDFEIIKGGRIIPINREFSIPERMHVSLKERGIIDPNEKYIKYNPPIPAKRRTLISAIIGGSREIMRQLAFGEQNVDFEKENNPDNSWVKRQKGIEEWAVDVYNFMASEFSEENIVAFIVHLDETNPHVHCKIIPVAKNNKISYGIVMHSRSKLEGIKYFRELHSKLAKINAKYGILRGEDKRITGAKHKDYKQWKNEGKNKKEKECEKLIEEKAELQKEKDELKSEISRLKEIINKLQHHG